MPAARRLVPAQIHAVSRRTANRTLLLRPTRAVNEILLYALALAASRHPVQLYAFCALVTHLHDCLADGQERSLLPDFCHTLHSLTARALNAHYARDENLWRAGSYENTEVHGLETLEDQLLYVWTQPVKDGLVATPDAWPGVKLLPEDIGRTITVARPQQAFFGGRRPPGHEPTDPQARRERREAREHAQRRRDTRARRKAKRKGIAASRLLPSGRKQPPPRPERPPSKLPETVTFTVARPPGYEHLTLDEVRAHFRRLLDARVADIHAARKAEGLTHFMGVKRILRQDPRTRLGETAPTFATNPRIACKDPERRRALLHELRTWRWAYREALAARRALQRKVRFPHGTYAMPKLHGALVAKATGPPPP